MATATVRREDLQAQPPVPRPACGAGQAICRGDHAGPTSALSPGFVQANLAILPKDLAEDFLLLST